MTQTATSAAATQNTLAENNTAKAPKKAKKGPKMDIASYMEEHDMSTETNKIESILQLHIKGYSNKDIIEAGFNKTTVYRQVGEYKKLQKAPLTHYMGFPVFEARIERVMKSKKLDRADAIEYIMQKDMDSEA